MFKLFRANPLLDQTLRAGRQPSPRVTLVLLIALLAGATAARAWLIDQLPTEVRAMLLLLLWLLPLATMAIAAVSTARRLRSESFQLVRQSPLTDRQVTWGLGLGTLYTLRLVLVLAFSLLPALVDDTPLGGASTALCLAGLHLAASMLGTVLMLRWGRHRLGVVLAAIVCALIVALLPTLKALNPVCVPIFLNTTQFRLSFLLLNQRLNGSMPLVTAGILPSLLGLATSLIPWRGKEAGWRPRLEMIGMVLAVGLALSLWIFDTSQIKERERQALVTIYYATDGDNWFQNDGWLNDQPVDSWYGVTCACGRVTELDLTENNLQGELPAQLGQLDSLKKLYLFYNKLSELPPEIGQLSSLQDLALDNNQILLLPPEIGQLTSLQTLGLSNNHFATLPPEIWQLTGLQDLHLNNNQLTELPPEVGQLTNLQELVLDNNQLSALPPEIWHLTSLQHYLGLSANQLTVLPSEIGQLTNLQDLSLSTNKLSMLPPEIGQLTNLQRLWINDNQLTELPPEIGRLTSLQQLWLGGNQLTELPPEIGRLTSLQLLSLSGNKLSKLPPDFGRLDNLLELHLSNNQITNPPLSLGQLTNLRWLHLESNPLLELPPEICQLPNLIDVMPPSLCN